MKLSPVGSANDMSGTYIIIALEEEAITSVIYDFSDLTGAGMLEASGIKGFSPLAEIALGPFFTLAALSALVAFGHLLAT